jgi:hypothetical protein
MLREEQVTTIPAPRVAPRLSDVLFGRYDRTFSSLAALPSNVEAIEAALLFSSGLNTFVALAGPSGWGKSYLMAMTAARYQRDSAPAAVLTADEYLAAPDRAGDGRRPLFLDDVQEVLNRPKHRMRLRLALERRVRAGWPTMLAFTAPKVTRQVRDFLPGRRDWILATIDAPQPSERIPLLNQIAQREGLCLSPALVRIVAHQMHGNGRTFSGALKRLRLERREWLDSGATLRACGLLDPFFTDNPDWDLKLRILRLAEANRYRFPQVSGVDLAVYVMLKEASLSESNVARSLGLEPAEAYLRSCRFQALMTESDVIRSYVRQFVDLVVEAVSNEEIR